MGWCSLSLTLSPSAHVNGNSCMAIDPGTVTHTSLASSYVCRRNVGIKIGPNFSLLFLPLHSTRRGLTALRTFCKSQMICDGQQLPCGRHVALCRYIIPDEASSPLAQTNAGSGHLFIGLLSDSPTFRAV